MIYTEYLPRGSEPTHPVAGFRPHQSTAGLVPLAAYSEADFSRHQTLLEQILLCEVSPCTAARTLWAGLILTVSQPKGQPQPQTSQQQSTRNYNKRAQPTQETSLEQLAQGTRETAPLSPTGHPLHKATLPRET